MSDLTDRLRNIASKATEGPWEIEWEHVSAWETSYGAYDVPVGLGPLRCDLLNEWEPGDLAHAATFDPALVAAMLDVIDAAEYRLAKDDTCWCPDPVDDETVCGSCRERESLARLREVAG